MIVLEVCQYIKIHSDNRKLYHIFQCLLLLQFLCAQD